MFNKTTSIRQYNKLRKTFVLGLDDNRKKLYPGDFVELSASVETRSKWVSRIWWSPLDGAYVESHPAHLFMKTGTGTRELSYFFREKWNVPFVSHDDKGEEITTYKPSHSIKKVTYKDYLSWKREREEKVEKKKKENEKSE